MAISRRAFLSNSTAVAGAAALSTLLPSAAIAASAPSRWDGTADIVVVGFGGAGGSASVEAADNGASVILLEKQKEDSHYSNTRMSGGQYHVALPGYNRDALKSYARAMFSGDNLPWKLEGEEDPVISEGLAAAWADALPNLDSWLKSLDSRFNCSDSRRSAQFKDFPGAAESGYGVHRYSFSGYARATLPGRDLPYLEKEDGEAYDALLKKAIADRSAKIKVYFECPATELITNNAGEVIGVKAMNRGRTVYYKANKAVILTSGGYEYNFDMRRAFCEGQGIEGWAFYGTIWNEGDGIAMAMKVGAGLAKVGKAAARFIGAVPVRHNGLKIGFSTPAVGRPRSIMVNTEGDRFMAETLVTDDPSRYFSYKEAVRFNITNLHYQNNPSWLIMDQTMVETSSVTDTAGSTIGYGYIPWSDDNMDAVNRGWLLKGNSLEELAAIIAKHPENKNQMQTEKLVNSVKRWNELCTAGEDTDHNRRKATLGPVDKAPYYALPLYAGGPNTKGGVMCNANRQVLTWNGTPIPRLYSAGEMSSCLKFVYQSGGNVTETMVMGRLAGRNAAKLSAVR